jgi:hypothetical protein
LERSLSFACPWLVTTEGESFAAFIANLGPTHGEIGDLARFKILGEHHGWIVSDTAVVRMLRGESTRSLWQCRCGE